MCIYCYGWMEKRETIICEKIEENRQQNQKYNLNMHFKQGHTDKRCENSGRQLRMLHDIFPFQTNLGQKESGVR